MFTTKNLFKIAGKHFLISLASIVISSAIVIYLSGQIANTSSKAAKSRRLAASLSEQTTLYSNLKKEIAMIGTSEAVMENAFPLSDNILAFVAALDSLALKNGLKQTYHFSSPTAPAISTTFPLEVIGYENTITTNVPTLIGYLRDFENLPYFTKINSITITSTAGDWRDSSNVSFHATLATTQIMQ